jgi:hypothetical protein
VPKTINKLKIKISKRGKRGGRKGKKIRKEKGRRGRTRRHFLLGEETLAERTASSLSVLSLFLIPQ